jgi:hypothetical protein
MLGLWPLLMFLGTFLDSDVVGSGSVLGMFLLFAHLRHSVAGWLTANPQLRRPFVVAPFTSGYMRYVLESSGIHAPTIVTVRSMAVCSGVACWIVGIILSAVGIPL